MASPVDSVFATQTTNRGHPIVVRTFKVVNPDLLRIVADHPRASSAARNTLFNLACEFEGKSMDSEAWRTRETGFIADLLYSLRLEGGGSRRPGVSAASLESVGENPDVFLVNYLVSVMHSLAQTSQPLPDPSIFAGQTLESKFRFYVLYGEGTFLLTVDR